MTANCTNANCNTGTDGVTKVVTFDNTTDTFTGTSHPFLVGDAITLTSTGSLPTGYAGGAVVYVISSGLAANTFKVSTTFDLTVPQYANQQYGIDLNDSAATHANDEMVELYVVGDGHGGTEMATHSNVGDSDVGSAAWLDFLDTHFHGPIARVRDPYAAIGLMHGM